MISVAAALTPAVSAIVIESSKRSAPIGPGSATN